MPTMRTLHPATAPFLLLAILSIISISAARILDEVTRTLAPPLPYPIPSPPEGLTATPAADLPPPAATTTIPAYPADVVTGVDHHPNLIFFIHDILGRTSASGQVVTGLPMASNLGAVPIPTTDFAKVGPVSSPSVSIEQGNKGGSTNRGDLPADSTVQAPLTGTVAVIDGEITEGEEAGSAIVGKAQGFYVASSEEGYTAMFTAQLLGGGNDGVEVGSDGTLAFFGVVRTDAPDSYLAVVGGTGKYANARGYASIGTVPPTSTRNQQTSGELMAVQQIQVYLS